MKTLKKGLCRTFALILCVTIGLAKAQPKEREAEFNYPEIGKECPDFTLNEIYNYPKSKASLQDFRGKWLILDFWTRGCSACIQSFPKLNELTKQFRDKVQIVLVGVDDKLIRKMYEKFRQKYDLDLTTAYDSVLHKRFAIPSYPYVMWIDEKGTIRAITDKPEMTAANIQAFLNGEHLKLPEKYGLVVREQKKYYDYAKPFLTDGNGGEDTDFLYRSVLSQWKKGIPNSIPIRFDAGGKLRNEFFIAGQDIRTFYRLAYGDTLSMTPADQPNCYGKYWPQPLLDVTDSSEFVGDNSTGKNIYCYDLIVPPAKKNRGKMQRMMQRDLQDYFGYTVTVETRTMPYWQLIAKEGADKKLRSTSKREVGGDGHTTTVLRNQPVSFLVTILWSKNMLQPPIVDETGISHNIDITVDAFLSDLNDVKKSLQRSGLDLIRSQKEMKVIVIRDKSSQ